MSSPLVTSLLDPALNRPIHSLMSLSCFPPELFPIIASFVPLRSAPRTLLALSLVNHDFYRITYRILYSRLVLRNEDAAISVIRKILDEPQLGRAVTEIHILAELSAEAREGRKEFDAVEGLQLIIKEKLLPRLVALGVHLGNGWDRNEDFDPILLHGRLQLDFWTALRIECPHLRSLSLRNVGHAVDDPYISGPVIDEILRILEISTLRLNWVDEGLSEEDVMKVFKSLPQLSTSLHTLSLLGDFQRVEQILSADFPSLLWLRLNRFVTDNDTSTITAFCKRHPKLESLSLVGCLHQWFSDGIEEDFLPSLKHLKARFEDVLPLTPILPRLVSLSFTNSYNCQVPYLLRAVIPAGLPGLKSLEIQQYAVGWDFRKYEGALWYETADGQFRKETNRKKMPRTFLDQYMHSIVRGAPNLEELALHGSSLNVPILALFGPTLAQLVNFKRFYYRGFSTVPTHGAPPPKENHEALISDFFSSAEALARTCTGLEKVTSIGGIYLPYLSAIIERDSNGDVTGVERSYGVGMEIPAQDDDPFPYNT